MENWFDIVQRCFIYQLSPVTIATSQDWFHWRRTNKEQRERESDGTRYQNTQRRGEYYCSLPGKHPGTHFCQKNGKCPFPGSTQVYVSHINGKSPVSPNDKHQIYLLKPSQNRFWRGISSALDWIRTSTKRSRGTLMTMKTAPVSAH